jgi:hypothetical protein
MTIVSITTLHTKPDASWADIQKHMKQGNDLARKHGAENVTMLAGIAAGTETGTLSIVSTAPDWTSYGKFLDSMMADPELQGLATDPKSPLASWDTYVLQTIPDM